MTPQPVQELPPTQPEINQASLHSALLTAAESFIQHHKELKPKSFQIIYIEPLKPPSYLKLPQITNSDSAVQTLNQFLTGTIIIDVWPNHNYRRQFIEYLRQNHPDLAQAYDANLARINIINNLLQAVTLLPKHPEVKALLENKTQPPSDLINQFITLIIKLQQSPTPINKLKQQMQSLAQQIQSLNLPQITLATKEIIDIIHRINHNRPLDPQNPKTALSIKSFDQLSPAAKYIITKTTWHLAVAALSLLPSSTPQ